MGCAVRESWQKFATKLLDQFIHVRLQLTSYLWHLCYFWHLLLIGHHEEHPACKKPSSKALAWSSSSRRTSPNFGWKMRGYLYLQHKTSDVSEMKQSRAKVTTVSIETRIWPIDWWQSWWPMVIGELWSTFPGSKIFPQQISCTLFVGAQRNLAVLGVWPIETYSPNLVNFGTRRWSSAAPPRDRPLLTIHGTPLERVSVYKVLGVFISADLRWETHIEYIILKSRLYFLKQLKLECGPMPNVMVALPNIGGALCSTPQSFADAHY